MVGVEMTTMRTPRAANCAQCGREVMANVQMLSDAPIVCAKCRCSVCRIVLSDAVCRCGSAHGKPSQLKQVCERCYQLLEVGAFTQPSLGIVGQAVMAFEQRLVEDDLIEDLEDADDAEFSLEEDVLSGSDEEIFQQELMADEVIPVGHETEF
jgi:hypothetical protein